jgi:hypothetical protein
MTLVKVRSVLTSATIEVSNFRPLLKSDIVILNQGFPFVCLSPAKLRSTDSVNPRAVLSRVRPRYRPLL